MLSLRLLPLGLCLAVTPAITLAELGPIVITASRTEQPRSSAAATVYVLDSAAIEASGARTTAELLRGMPGVQLTDLFGNGTDVSVSVRGFAETANANTLVLVNGRRMNYSDTTGPDLHHIFPKDIERIEVLAGSAGALYGDQAVGGVINIITKRPETSAHSVSARAGSYDYRGLQFNSSARLNDALGYRLSAESFASDHYRDNNAEDNVNFSGVLDYAAGNNRIFLEVQEIDQELELPGALFEDEFEDDPTQSLGAFGEDLQNERTSVYRLGYAREFGMHRFSIDTTRRETDADVRQSGRTSPAPETGFTDRENNSINPKLSGTIDTTVEIPYVLGVDIEETDYELEIPFEFPPFPPGILADSNEQKTESLYFQLNPRVTDDLQLTFGMRDSSVENDFKDAFSFPDGIDVDDDITVYELGVAYFIDANTRISLRVDENFRFAKVNELGQAAPGEILDTQTGESYEIGIDTTFGDQQLTASIYQLDLSDEIFFDPTAGAFGENVNLDKTRRNGLNLSWYSQLSADLGMRFDLSLVDAEFRSGFFDGKDISGVSDQIVKLRGDYRVNDFLTTYLEYNYRSPYYPEGDNSNDLDKTGSITVYNAGLAYFYKAWTLAFRINNLADESYAESINSSGGFQPSPERNYLLTAEYRIE